MNRVRVRLFNYPFPTTQGSISYDYTPERLKAWGNPIYDDTVDFERFVNILPEEPPDYIKLIDDDSLMEHIKKCVDVSAIGFRYGEFRDSRTEEQRTGWDSNSVSFGSSKSPPPMPLNVTADVYARAAGKEYRIGTATGNKGDKRIHFDIEGLDGEVEPFETFDLVLRPNPRLARDTLDIYEIYNGVIVKEGIRAEFQESERR